MSYLQLLPNALAQPRTTVHYAEVSRLQPLPASFSDPLHIIFPDWDSETFWTIAADAWPRCHGSSMPAAGASCLVIYDNRNNMRLVWWGPAGS